MLAATTHFSWSGTGEGMGTRDNWLSQRGYEMLYWSQECVCITACRSKKCVCLRVGNSAQTQEQPPPSPSFRPPPSVPLVGSFNESQFLTPCHITPLNDLIKQSRHLCSPAISLFTTASTVVTQFHPPPPPALCPPSPAGIRWDPIAMPQHLPAAINFTLSLSNLFKGDAITCL